MPAIICHAYILHINIDTKIGQNLSISNILSLSCWLICLWTVYSNLKRNFNCMVLLAFPLSLFSSLAAYVIPGELIIKTKNSHLMLSHILLAITAFSVLGLAAMHAILIQIQQKFAKTAQLSNFGQLLPPIDALESWLFGILRISFILLSAACIYGIIYWQYNYSNYYFIKIIGSIFAWLLIAYILVKKSIIGIKGEIASKTTLAALGCLIISVFATKIWIT